MFFMFKITTCISNKCSTIFAYETEWTITIKLSKNGNTQVSKAQIVLKSPPKDSSWAGAKGKMSSTKLTNVLTL